MHWLVQHERTAACGRFSCSAPNESPGCSGALLQHQAYPFITASSGSHSLSARTIISVILPNSAGSHSRRSSFQSCSGATITWQSSLLIGWSAGSETHAHVCGGCRAHAHMQHAVSSFCCESNFKDRSSRLRFICAGQD